MKKLFLIAIIFLVPYLFSLSKDANQTLDIQSTPTGASVSLSTGQSCTTPCSLTVHRAKTLKMTVGKSGCLGETKKIEPHFAGFGKAFDTITKFGFNAFYELRPNPVHIALQC